MTFTTLTYLAYLPLIFAAYWLLRRRRPQNLLLIAASYTFYGWWDYRFCLLMLTSSLMDFTVSRRLGTTEAEPVRRLLLAISLATNLGLLAVFKYFNFFIENFQALAHAAGWAVDDVTLHIILPVGISFYTFQTLGYTVDVYRRQMQPTSSLVDYLAFVSFFPQLVAGPIERAERLLSQFGRSRAFDPLQARDGCRLILWGFFKKIALADRLAVLVNERYGQPELLDGPQLALATVCFAFQIYCDFSAYSDIAIGTAKLFNIELMRNFAYPYFSQSVAEFWRRWHISLSTWFRDYVFIPLGGSRATRTKTTRNLLATFLISGLWHGAAWHFVFWGGINGLATAPWRRATSQRRDGIPGGERLLPRPSTLLRILTTFGVICVAWVFFRAETVPEALRILQRIATDALYFPAYLQLAAQIDDEKFLRKTLIVLAVFVLVEWVQRRNACPLTLDHWPLPLRWATYTLLIWTTLDLMPRSGGQDFIYFDF